MQVAQPPEPQHVLPTPPRYQPAERARQFAALTPVAPQRLPAFSLVSRANAAPVPIRRGGFAPGGWAVQVGAFENANLASAATTAARATARDVLGGAHSAVSSVRQPHGTLYRARLVGLSHDAAAYACERLVRIRTNCMIVSPAA
jgi:cell division protein FtsN